MTITITITITQTITSITNNYDGLFICSELNSFTLKKRIYENEVVINRKNTVIDFV